MTDLQTRVARAIYEKRNGPGCKPWSLLTKAHREPYEQDADAAIGLVREECAKVADKHADTDREIIENSRIGAQFHALCAMTAENIAADIRRSALEDKGAG